MISLVDVTKVYEVRGGLHTVINGINLEVQRGEKIGILGGNGAGKSSLIRIISGAELPSSGRVSRDMSVSWPLGFTGAFQGSLTGIDNVRFICRVYNRDIASAIEYVKEFTELGSYLNEPVKNYSSGMRAKLAFALSLTIEFDCYLIDELMSVGDSRFQEKCNLELFDKRKDRSLIIVSHLAARIQKLCQKACVLKDGVLYHFSTVDEAYEFYNKK